MPVPAGSYLQYVLKVKNMHRVHSPFMFSLYQDVIRNTRQYYIFEEIEEERKRLLQDSELLSNNDPGAGSRGVKPRTVSEIAAVSLVRPAYGRMLFKLVQHFQYKNMLELGTSLGISGAYLAAAAADANLITIEGREEISRKAAETFGRLGLRNITQIQGLFENTLETALQQLKNVDLVYLDGDHRGEAVKQHVKTILPFLSKNALIVVDDIRWSPSMWQAWQELKKMPEFEVTADLLRMGLLFKRPGQASEDFTLYPPR
ncbi:MAG: class I SAM-dependent methyltransferase [Bacteroidia bacterium]